MTLVRKAASGAVWTIGTGVLARIVGLVGTLFITHHLAPSVMGEVASATILALTANWISHWGFNQYVIVKGEENADNLFHATVLHLTCGLAAITLVLTFESQFTEFLNAPNLGDYLPGMALSVAIKRLASIPDKLLMRDMRFKVVAIAGAAGEFTYIALAVGLVLTTDLGGQAIVIANIVQAIITSSIEIAAVGTSRWLTPKPWNWQRAREIFRFGTPLAIETVLSEAGRYWDKLLFARLFGPHHQGMYGLAYNLSDLPATYVGEHVATVLFPTMVQIEPEKRNALFCRACGLLALIVLPMAVGLASVADTLVKLLLPNEWQGVADFLVVVATVAIFRPLNAVISSLLMATERNRMLMLFELLKVILLLTGMWFLSRFGEVPAAAAIGLAMAIQAIGLVLVMATQGFPAGRLLVEFRGPAIAASMIVATVLGLRELFLHWEIAPLALQLATEIIGGALVYLLGVWIFARSALIRLIDVLKQQISKRPT